MEKLKQELEQSKDQSLKLVGEYILERLAQTGGAVGEKKTLKACMEEIRKKARTKAVGGVAMIDDETVFGWASEYFGLAKETKEEAPKPQTPVTGGDDNGLDFSLEDLF